MLVQANINNEDIGYISTFSTTTLEQNNGCCFSRLKILDDTNQRSLKFR